MSGTKTRVAVILTVALSVWLVHRFMFPPSEAQVHERAWRDARNKIRDSVYGDVPQEGWDYLRPKTWGWYFQGKPDRDRVWQQFNDHEKELVRLGVLASETVVLTNRVYHEAMTNGASFLYGPRGIGSDDGSGISLFDSQQFRIVGRPVWVRELAEAFRTWDGEGENFSK